MSDNFVWTKHVQERAYQRGVTDSEVWSTLRNPDQSESQGQGKYKFFKKFGEKQLVLVAAPQGNKWVILTTWVKDRQASREYWAGKKSGYSGDLLTRLVMKLLKRLFGR